VLLKYQFPRHEEEKKTLRLIDVFCLSTNDERNDHSACFAVLIQSQKKIMELFRQRLLESTTKQSDLIEIFSAIDRGYL
jgi:hypothetical protein